MVRPLSFAAGLALAMMSMACVAQTPEPPPAPATTAEPATAPATSKKTTFSACHVDGPYIAMTFDDGPHVQNTPRLLDMLKERKIHATFFLIGENAVQYPQIIKRIVAEGHEIGNHSYTHPQLSKMNDESVRSQFEKTQEAIVAGGAPKPNLMRPPYGAFTERQQRWALGEFGFKTILWDVDPLDWKVRNAAHVESEILKQTVAGSIILSHDIHKTTVDAMPETLDALLAKGFKFVTVSELIAMDHPAPPKVKASPGAKKGAVVPAPASVSVPPAEPATAAAPAAPVAAPALRGAPR